MIKIQLNVKAISKEKLYQGKKGTYLNAVLIETPDSEYSDFMIVEETTKEEREDEKKGTILGNGKYLKRKEEKPAEAAPENKLPGEEPATDDLPF